MIDAVFLKRACQAGPRGGRPVVVLNTENLERAGFVEQMAGRTGPLRITPFFVRFILDPASILRENPDFQFARLGLNPEEQMFFFTCYRNTSLILNGLIKNGTTAGADLLSDQWVSDIASFLAKLEAGSWTLPKSSDPAESRAEARKLKSIGLIADRKGKIDPQSITRFFIRFIIDPIGFLKAYPTIENPLQGRKRADVAGFYVWAHKNIIGALEKVMDFERAAGAEFSTEHRVNMIYNMLHLAAV